MQKNIQAVERSLLAGRGARRRLPGGGHVQIDRLQPFLVVHRRRSAGTDQATDKLVTHSASLLNFGEEEDVAELVEMIVRRGTEAFGSFLLLEIWAGPEPEPGAPPRFGVYGPKRSALIPLVELLQRDLAGIHLADKGQRWWCGAGCPSAGPVGLKTVGRSPARGCGEDRHTSIGVFPARLCRLRALSRYLHPVRYKPHNR